MCAGDHPKYGALKRTSIGILAASSNSRSHCSISSDEGSAGWPDSLGWAQRSESRAPRKERRFIAYGFLTPTFIRQRAFWAYSKRGLQRQSSSTAQSGSTFRGETQTGRLDCRKKLLRGRRGSRICRQAVLQRHRTRPTTVPVHLPGNASSGRKCVPTSPASGRSTALRRSTGQLWRCGTALCNRLHVGAVLWGGSGVP